MVQIINSYGFTSEQLDLLDAVLPENCDVAVDDWLEEAIFGNKNYCLINEVGIISYDPLLPELHRLAEFAIPSKVIWVGGCPPFPTFSWCRDFEEAVEYVSKLVREALQ